MTTSKEIKLGRRGNPLVPSFRGKHWYGWYQTKCHFSWDSLV